MKVNVELEREGDSEMFEDLERYLKYHPAITRFLFNPAGFTFLMGWFLFFGMVLGWFGIYIVAPEKALDALAVLGLEAFQGREVAIPVGILQYHLPPLLIFGISFSWDLLSTAWIYPIFYLYRRRNARNDNFAGYFFQKMEQKAQRNRAFIERYGAVGLYLFMLIPFAVNGPLIGAIIGKLAGIRTRYILPTVVLATFTASAAWTAAYYYAATKAQDFLARIDERWVTWGMMGILGVVLLFTGLGFIKDVRRFRRIRARRRQLARETHITETLYAAPPEGQQQPPPPPS